MGDRLVGHPQIYIAEVRELYLHPQYAFIQYSRTELTLRLVVSVFLFRPQKPFVSCRRFGFTIGTAVSIVTACSADVPNNVLMLSLV
jgi:hypothetical protein